ncbi:hypothetical protein HY629_02340 [Candidatus Uhrbacteria bacterium]|nr:hypothetical protein [Candidatus Uhrbacteria bacterium]
MRLFLQSQQRRRGHMSLWCGACRREIFEGFGMLYRCDRTAEGFELPNKAADIVPPNSAVCDQCWKRLPAAERLPAVADLGSEIGGQHIFVYEPADSGRCGWGSKSWDSIQADAKKRVFLRAATVERFFPQTLPIIAANAQERIAAHAEDAEWQRSHRL